MAGERTFVVKFISDIAGATKGIKKVGNDLGGMGSKLSSVLPSFKAVAIAGTAAFGAVAASSLKLVNMASNLEESQSKVNVVFGASAKIVNDFAATSATSFGITKQAALEATGTFGNLLQAFGVGKSQAADMSTTLIGLAADLASFNNTGIEDAIQALRSGLSGETEPLKRFGVALNDVRLKQEATTLGLYDGKGALDINAKTQAAYALILKDTSLAQGDFARTSGGFANQMRILKASLSDAATELGVVLLPYFKTFVTFINENIVPGVLAFADTIGEKGLVPALAAGVAAMGQFGITTVNVLEGSYVALLNFTHDLSKTVRILADAAALGFGLQGNIIGAGKSLAVAVAMSKVQDATNEALAGAGAMFDGFRAKVYAAQLQLAQMGKPPKDVSDSLDRMSQATRSATYSVSSFNPIIKELGTGSKGAAKAVLDATEKLKVYTDELSSSNSARKSYNNAQRDSVRAGESLTEANINLTDAQNKFNQAVQGFGVDSKEARKAAVELGAAERDLERANFGVEKSIQNVVDAEKNLAEVRAKKGADPRDIREAEIGVARAKQDQAKSILDIADAEKELQKVRRRRRASPEDLFKAETDLTNAKFNVEEAVFAVADAEKKLSDVRLMKGATPEEIRDAEIGLAEAKLSVVDASDAQTDATDSLTKKQDLLNEAISGALTDSETYKTLSDELKDAKLRQRDATDGVTEAIDRETEALENYGKAIEAVGKIALLYPKVVGNFVAANPVSGVAGTIPSTLTGNSTGFNPNGSPIVINVNAGVIASESEVADTIGDLLARRARLNGGNAYATF
jgi:predicted  nucleic acid-binding Zn-ribbon protein